MAKKRNRSRAEGSHGARDARHAGTAAPAAPRDAGATLAAILLGLVLAGTALAVDSVSASAFDAPKRLAALVGVALAAAAAFLWPRPDSPSGTATELWRRIPPPCRAALAFAAGAVVLAVVAALASPRRAMSLDALRAVGILALLLPLGASRVFPRAGAALAGVFLGAAAVNAIVSILESRGLYSPFQLETFGARQETGAFAGNVGYLALVLALAVIVALGILVSARRPLARVGAAAALVLFAGGLLVNLNLTALTAALAGAAVVLVLRFRAKAKFPLLAAAALVALAVAAYAPLRFRAGELVRAARTGHWDALVSFRGGPWASALEMIRERPILGYGPGTFAAEYVPHRLAAEIRAGRRFDSPLRTSSYSEAHSDYLQVGSDAGVPAALLAAGAAGCLLTAILAAAWKRRDGEAILLAAILTAGAAAALTWFPFQRPITAVPLLLVAGRAWKVAVAADAHPSEEPAA